MVRNIKFLQFVIYVNTNQDQMLPKLKSFELHIRKLSKNIFVTFGLFVRTLLETMILRMSNSNKF